MDKLKSRIELEDIFQRMLCAMLPKMPPQDIRPTFQQAMQNGKYVINEFGETEIIPFTPSDNVIYFTVTTNPNSTQSYTLPDGTTQLRQEVNLQISFYGGNSSELSTCAFSLMRVEAFRYMLEAQGLYLETMDETVSQMERHDFSATFNQSIEIANPIMNKIAEHAVLGIQEDTDDV